MELKDTADCRVRERRRVQSEPERNRSAKAAVQGECSCSRELSRVGQECCSLLFSCPHSCTETLAIIDPVLDPLCYLLLSPGLSFSVSLAFLLLVLSFSLTHPGGIPLSSDTGPPSVSISFFFHLFLPCRRWPSSSWSGPLSLICGVVHWNTSICITLDRA